MRKISDLKTGDKIYDIDFRSIKWYTYFCVHPHNKKYHILIDAGEEPVRIYEEKLETILSQGFKSREDALFELSDRLEASSKRIKQELLIVKQKYGKD
jgi:hypothetical protein